MTEQPWTSREDAAEWAADLLRETRMTTTELAAKSTAGTLKVWEERHWNAIRTINWFAKGMAGEPPCFSAWLLAQVARRDDVGKLARNFGEYSRCAVAITSAEFRSLYFELADVMWGRNDDWLDPLETATVELRTAAKANRWRNILSQEGYPGADVVHALYRFYGVGNRLLYIGLTLNPGSRWKDHAKGKPWWHEVRNITIELHPSRAAVEIAEKAAIKAERPLHNVVHNSGGPVPDVNTTPACRCDTCREYESVNVHDRPEWDTDSPHLAAVLTAITQTRLGLVPDPWDWRPASHCDLDRAVQLVAALTPTPMDLERPR